MTIPPIGAATSRVPLQQQVMLVANRADGAQPSLSSGGSDDISYRNAYTCLAATTSVRLLYSNRQLLATDGETTPADAYTIKATFETPAGRLLPVLFSGVREVEIAAGAELLSDPIPVALAAGDKFFVRSRPLSAILGETWPIAGGANLGTLAGGGHVSGDQVDGASALFVGTAVSAGPAQILGVTTGVPVASAVIMGDSIGYGSGDVTSEGGDYGFLARILTSLDVPHFKMASPSMAFAHWLGSTDADLMEKTIFSRAWFDRARPSHAVICMGNNNVHAADTLETCQAGFTRWCDFYAAMGMSVVCTTISPRTTGSWATRAGQTKSSAALNTKRHAFNEWLRTKPHTSVVGVWELAGAVCDQTDPDLWRVDGGAHTNDGTHPNSTGHARATAAILEAVSSI
jgi:hypothetical protein